MCCPHLHAHKFPGFDSCKGSSGTIGSCRSALVGKIDERWCSVLSLSLFPATKSPEVVSELSVIHGHAQKTGDSEVRKRLTSDQTDHGCQSLDFNKNTLA